MYIFADFVVHVFDFLSLILHKLLFPFSARWYFGWRVL